MLSHPPPSLPPPPQFLPDVTKQMGALFCSNCRLLDQFVLLSPPRPHAATFPDYLDDKSIALPPSPLPLRAPELIPVQF